MENDFRLPSAAEHEYLLARCEKQILRSGLRFALLPTLILILTAIVVMTAQNRIGETNSGLRIVWVLIILVTVLCWAGTVAVYFAKCAKMRGRDYMLANAEITEIRRVPLRRLVFNVKCTLENGRPYRLTLLAMDVIALKEGMSCRIVKYGPVWGSELLRCEIYGVKTDSNLMMSSKK